MLKRPSEPDRRHSMSWSHLVLVSLLIASQFGFPAVAQGETDSTTGVVETWLQSVILRVQNYFNIFKTGVIALVRVAYNLMALVGLVFWLSGFHTFSGRNLIVSAVLLAFASELFTQIF